MPTKNVLLAVSAVLVAVALVLGGVYMLRPTEATTDSSCQAVGKLLKYSNDEMARIQKHNEKVAETRDAERQDEAIPMYQKWAATIRDYAEQISDPEVKGVAVQMADAADEVTEREIQFLGSQHQDKAGSSTSKSRRTRSSRPAARLKMPRPSCRAGARSGLLILNSSAARLGRHHPRRPATADAGQQAFPVRRHISRDGAYRGFSMSGGHCASCRSRTFPRRK